MRCKFKKTKKKISHNIIAISLLLHMLTMCLSGCSFFSQENENLIEYSTLSAETADNEFSKVFYENVTIEIVSVDEEKNLAEVLINFPDLKSIYDSLLSEQEASDFGDAIINEIENGKNYENVQIQIEAEVEKKDSWEITSAEEIDEAIRKNLEEFVVYALEENGEIEL